MANKKPTRGDAYREILAKDGISFEDCRVLSFVFEDERQPHYFHYRLMDEKPDYFIFDWWEKYANVVVPKDATNDAHIILIAEALGGQKTMPNLG